MDKWLVSPVGGVYMYANTCMTWFTLLPLASLKFHKEAFNHSFGLGG